MMQRYEVEPAFVLHSRLYRETSSIIDIFSEQHGRLSVIGKGCRRPKSRWRGLLQPFTPLLLSFAGRGELMTLTSVDVQSLRYQLKGDQLFSAMYLNELLMYLLEKSDPHPDLYQRYQHTLTQLAVANTSESILRSFEKYLLQVIGYGINWQQDYQNGAAVDADHDYYFHPEHGFTKLQHASGRVEQRQIFKGAVILAIADEAWQANDCLSSAKRVMRLSLLTLLGHRKIKTRELFLKQITTPQQENIL